MISEINFQRTYNLYADFEDIRNRAAGVLRKYLGYPDLLSFNDLDSSVTFTSERLIPTISTGRPRLLLLFSNPHPHSIHQGMLLSPNTRGRESDFWPLMEAAGWLPIPKLDRTPRQLAEICLNVQYQGPFDLLFYCYYAFPTDYPKDLLTIFGKEYFNQHIELEAKDEFRKTLRETPVEAVVSFNRGIINIVSNAPVDRYTYHLKAGELVQGQLRGIESHVPIFQTFPTGWRYTPWEARVASLGRIKETIGG